MAPLLRNPEKPWKRAAFTTAKPKNQNVTGRSVRTERWRYSEYDNPHYVELYDHKTDPGEFKNLASDPKHVEVVEEMSALLKEGWKAALP